MYSTLTYVNTILGVWDDLVGYYIGDILDFTWGMLIFGSFNLVGGIMLGDSRMSTSFIFIRWPAQPRNPDVAIFQTCVFDYFRAVTHAFYLRPNCAGAEDHHIIDFSIYALYCLYGVKEIEPGLLLVTYGADPQISTWQPMSENLLYEKQTLYSWCWAPGDATYLTEDNWKAIKYVSANYSNSMLYCVAFTRSNKDVVWMYASTNLAQLKEFCKCALSIPGTLLVRRVSDPSHLLEHYYL